MSVALAQLATWNRENARDLVRLERQLHLARSPHAHHVGAAIRQRLHEEQRWNEGLSLLDADLHQRLLRNLDAAIMQATTGWTWPTLEVTKTTPLTGQGLWALRDELKWLNRRLAREPGIQGGSIIGSFAEGTGKEGSDLDLIPKLEPGVKADDAWKKLTKIESEFTQQFGIELHVLDPSTKPWPGSAVYQLGAPLPSPVPPDTQAVAGSLAAELNQAAWVAQGVQMYLGMAMPTGAAAGQSAFDYMGLNRTFAWAHPQAMARDMYQVRGSKIIQSMYGSHVDQLSKIIIRATDPRNPLTLDQVKAEIHKQWPKLRKYQVERIARTETATLWTHTAMQTYAANGITEFESLIAEGPMIGIESETPCDECVAAAQDSPWPVGDAFDIPPWHANCRCEAVPVLDTEDGPWLPPDEPWEGGGEAEEPELDAVGEPLATTVATPSTANVTNYGPGELSQQEWSDLLQEVRRVEFPESGDMIALEAMGKVQPEVTIGGVTKPNDSGFSLLVSRKPTGELSGIGTYSAVEQRFGKWVPREVWSGGNVAATGGAGLDIFKGMLQRAADSGAGLQFESTKYSLPLYRRLGIPEGPSNAAGGATHTLTAGEVQQLSENIRALRPGGKNAVVSSAPEPVPTPVEAGTEDWDKLKDEVLAWERPSGLGAMDNTAQAQQFMRIAVMTWDPQAERLFTMHDAAGELRAVMRVSHQGNDVLWIDDLGSTLHGGGTELMKRAAMIAVEEDRAIELAASPAGVGFYEKLGFHNTTSLQYRLDGPELEQLAAKSGEAGAAVPGAPVAATEKPTVLYSVDDWLKNADEDPPFLELPEFRNWDGVGSFDGLPEVKLDLNTNVVATESGSIGYGGEGPLTEGAIDVVKYGDKYYVWDGHNRVAAAIRNGDVKIQARVIDAGGPKVETAPVAPKPEVASDAFDGQSVPIPETDTSRDPLRRDLAKWLDESDWKRGIAADTVEALDKAAKYASRSADSKAELLLTKGTNEGKDIILSAATVVRVHDAADIGDVTFVNFLDSGWTSERNMLRRIASQAYRRGDSLYFDPAGMNGIARNVLEQLKSQNLIDTSGSRWLIKHDDIVQAFGLEGDELVGEDLLGTASRNAIPYPDEAGWLVVPTRYDLLEAIKKSPSGYIRLDQTYLEDAWVGQGQEIKTAILWEKNGTLVKAEVRPDQAYTTNPEFIKLRDKINTLFENGFQSGRQVDLYEFHVVKQKSPDDKGGRNSTIAAQAGNNRITFWHGGTYMRQEDFDHELGHIMGVGGGPPDRLAWDTAGLQDAVWSKKLVGIERGSIRASADHNVNIGKKTITPYAATNRSEDWAESVAKYALSARENSLVYLGGQTYTFTDLFPNRAKLINELLKPVHEDKPRFTLNRPEPAATEPPTPRPPSPSPEIPGHLWEKIPPKFGLKALSGGRISVVNTETGKAFGKIFSSGRFEIKEEYYRLLDLHQQAWFTPGAKGYYNSDFIATNDYGKIGEVLQVLQGRVYKFRLADLRRRLRLAG